MDVTTATFKREVVEASNALPVVVDFWAPWCGPCRTLTPIIEKVAREFAGRVKLVKVNSDDNPELSSGYSIRSIPNVIAFKNGRPAAQFMGAQPESQVRAFFEKLVPSLNEEALRNAEALFAAGQYDDAERQLAVIKPDLDSKARIDALRQGIAYARAGATGPGENELKAKIEANPADHEARLALAALYAGQRRYPEAMAELVEIVRRAKNWRDGEARKQLLASVRARGGPARARRGVSPQARGRAVLRKHAARADRAWRACCLSAGLLWPWISKLGLGRLPGDIRIQTENGVFYFPLMTCIVISVILSLAFWLFRR